MQSIWNDIKKPEFDTLYGDIKTDVLVIGAGMCGILCGYMLKNAGIDCVVAEADKICNGVTNGTTAKITLGHGIIYDKIIKKYGEHTAQLYYKSQKEAFDKLIFLASKGDFDLNICDSYVYSLNDKKIIEDEVMALKKIGADSEFCKQTELPFKVAGAVRIPNQANFHPLKFAYAIAKNLKIFENTKVIDLKQNTAICEKGTIKFKKVIVATHFPFINTRGLYFMKMYQHRSYVIALKTKKNVKGMYVDEAKSGLSFRSYGDLLLLGGGSHRTGGKGGNWGELRDFKNKYYPDSKEVGYFATQDCMTLDSIPYIGEYSNSTPDIYVATGFNKWGMTSSMVSAMLLKDMISGTKNEYQSVYSPDRTMLHPQLAVNMFESVKGLITPKAPRCPHLGCVLKYNKYEHSWDCPCHGSRFDKDGKLLNNPATADKKM